MLKQKYEDMIINPDFFKNSIFICIYFVAMCVMNNYINMC